MNGSLWTFFHVFDGTIPPKHPYSPRVNRGPRQGRTRRDIPAVPSSPAGPDVTTLMPRDSMSLWQMFHDTRILPDACTFDFVMSHRQRWRKMMRARGVAAVTDGEINQRRSRVIGNRVTRSPLRRRRLGAAVGQLEESKFSPRALRDGMGLDGLAGREAVIAWSASGWPAVFFYSPHTRAFSAEEVG